MFAQIHQLKVEVNAILETCDTSTANQIRRSRLAELEVADEHFTSATQKESLLRRLKKIQKLEKEWREVYYGLQKNSESWSDDVLFPNRKDSRPIDYTRCSPAFNQ